ncbi:MAG: hypothetical protein EAZ63_03655 [Runella slithyformis]|nr:MAG: hypothetical protein EAZ63_03655 [Runella slithyformis]
MILTIPVKAYVRCFLTKFYGREPIYVRADSKLGRLFVLCFSKGLNVPIDATDLGELQEHLEELGKREENKVVDVRFDVRFENGLTNVTPNNLVRMSYALEAEFEKGAFFFSLGRRVFFNSEKASVKHFLQICDIKEDELKEDTAVKIVQRDRKKYLEG